jgi:hypothetical protein
VLDPRAPGPSSPDASAERTSRDERGTAPRGSSIDPLWGRRPCRVGGSSARRGTVRESGARATAPARGQARRRDVTPRATRCAGLAAQEPASTTARRRPAALPQRSPERQRSAVSSSGAAERQRQRSPERQRQRAAVAGAAAGSGRRSGSGQRERQRQRQRAAAAVSGQRQRQRPAVAGAAITLVEISPISAGWPVGRRPCETLIDESLAFPG